MTHPNPSTALARVVIDELADRGVALVVLSPGSRSAALAIAASTHPDIETRVVIDERSAAFHALGSARVTGKPVAVACTSGSAPANFFPAVVEADMSCMPLVIVTADRPVELQGVGANQTIDQVGMFGSKVRDQASIEAPDASRDLNRAWREEVARIVRSAMGLRPGPVHLNVRFREPTVPVTDDGRSEGEEYGFDTPRIESHEDPAGPPATDLPSLSATRGLLIAGDGDYDRAELDARANAVGWPVLATALSGMRGRRVVGTYHHILRHGVPSELKPETVVALGAIGPSPRLDHLLTTATNRVRVDKWGRTIDPERNATHIIQGDIRGLLQRVDGAADHSWAEVWWDAETESRKRLDGIVERQDGMSGASVVAALNEVDWEGLAVASSLPIREVDAHLRRAGQVYANRGASGIDGFVSTALGVAANRPRALALTGDLALLHDANGFLYDGEIDLTMVVMDNGGGGLFDSLPHAVHAPEYERLFVTNPHRDLSDLARLHRLRHLEATTLDGLRRLANEALERPGVDLIRVPVERSHDLEMRAQLDM